MKSCARLKSIIEIKPYRQKKYCRIFHYAFYECKWQVSSYQQKQVTNSFSRRGKWKGGGVKFDDNGRLWAV